MNNSPEIKTYQRLKLSDVASLICRGGRVLILTHVNPDGDCVGSAFALAGLINGCGGRARVACPSEMPKRLRFLCGDQMDFGVGEIEDYHRIFAIDVASPMQLGDFAYLIPKIDVMIDHHGMGEAFAPNYIDPKAAAAGEIVFELYKMLCESGAMGRTPGVARRIYAAIVSDTGSFKQSNTTPKTHIIASALVDEINNANDGGADTTEVARSLFGQRTLKELTAQMLSIQNLSFFEEGRLAAILFTQQMLLDNDLTEEHIGNVVETPRGVEGVLVGIAVKQAPDDLTKFRISSRANADIDCSAVCAKFGGGGHVRAAGCTVMADTPEEALAVVAGAFGEAIRAYVSERQ